MRRSTVGRPRDAGMKRLLLLMMMMMMMVKRDRRRTAPTVDWLSPPSSVQRTFDVG